MTNVTPTILSTVSSQFVDDWLVALRALCPEAQMASLLSRSGLNAETRSPNGRVTLDQIVCLYQLAAVETGDEMMGLWSSPSDQGPATSFDDCQRSHISCIGTLPVFDVLEPAAG